MGQTLYAIIAMMIVSLFSLQQQRHAIRTQLDMIESEIATVASSVAAERLDEIGALAFDQNVKGGQIQESPNGLTPRSGFGTGEGRDQPGDDLDDFDDASVVVERDVDGRALRFQVESTVDYADPYNTDQAVTGPTKYKIVTVTLHALDSITNQTVTLSQSFSCKSACQW